MNASHRHRVWTPMRARVLALLVILAACVPAQARSAATDDKPRVAATAAGAAPLATPVLSRDAATAACPAPPTVIEKLQARYDTTKAFRAEFSQQTKIAAVGEGEEARGTVAFKKPGKMRWDYSAPEGQRIISDGITLWIYQPADRQVVKAAFKAAFVSTTPVSFLAGVGRISDDFRAERDARGCSAGRIYVTLVPKSSQDLGSLGLAVDAATFDIVEAAVTDPIGNVTTLSFANMQRNVEIPDPEFGFTVPPGVDVISAPGAAAPP